MSRTFPTPEHREVLRRVITGQPITPWQDREVMCRDGITRTNAEIAAYLYEQIGDETEACDREGPDR